MAKDTSFEPQAPSSDEISLRDLYLIFKRGLPIIVGAALLLGAIAFSYTSMLPPIYEAESTTLITPPPVNVQGQVGISFNPTVNVSYEAYQTLALSRPVMEMTLARFPDAPMTVNSLQGASSLERLLGPRFPEQVAPLSVSHRVRHPDPEMSAALSNAWTESTLETIRSSLLAGLGPVDEATGGEVQVLRERLTDTENRWRSFQEEDETSILTARLERLVEQLTDNEARLNELERLITIAEARRDTVEEQLQTELIRTTSSDPTSDAFLAGLNLSEARNYLQEQRRIAEDALQEARQALAEFNAQHNLPLIEAELDFLLRGDPRRSNMVLGEEAMPVQSLPAMYQRLRRLPREIAQTEAQLSALDQEGNELLSANARARLASLREELSGLPEEIAATEAQIQALQEALATLEQERNVLNANLEVREDIYTTIVERAQQLNLTAQDPRESERVLRDTTPAVLSLQQELRISEADLQGFRIERDALETQLGSLQTAAEQARRQVAALDLQRSQLELDLENTRDAYQSVVRLQPTISYVTQLAPLSARILSAATIPDEPVGPRRMVNTVLAILLGGMLATLFVFLREAVSGAATQPERPRRKDVLAPTVGSD